MSVFTHWFFPAYMAEYQQRKCTKLAKMICVKCKETDWLAGIVFQACESSSFQLILGDFDFALTFFTFCARKYRNIVIPVLSFPLLSWIVTHMPSF